MEKNVWIVVKDVDDVEDGDGDVDASIHLLLPREDLRAGRPRVAALDFHFNHLRV